MEPGAARRARESRGAQDGEGNAPVPHSPGGQEIAILGAPGRPGEGSRCAPPDGRSGFRGRLRREQREARRVLEAHGRVDRASCVRRVEDRATRAEGRGASVSAWRMTCSA